MLKRALASGTDSHGETDTFRRRRYFSVKTDGSQQRATFTLSNAQFTPPARRDVTAYRVESRRVGQCELSPPRRLPPIKKIEV